MLTGGEVLASIFRMSRPILWLGVVVIAGLAVWVLRGGGERLGYTARETAPYESATEEAGGSNLRTGELPGSRQRTLSSTDPLPGSSGKSSSKERYAAKDAPTRAQQSQRVRPAFGPSSDSGGTLEVDISRPVKSEGAESLKPQRKDAVQSEAVVEEGLPGPPPEVVFESEKDQHFVTETQVELKDAGKIGGEAGSVALWIKPDWQPDDQNDAMFVQLGERGIRFTKNVNFLRFEFIDDDGLERGAGVPIDSWKPGEWHHIAGAWVQGRLHLYVDGHLVSQNQFESAPTFEDEARVYIGSNLPSGSAAPGEMTGIRILNRPLAPEEVKQLADAAQRPH